MIGVIFSISTSLKLRPNSAHFQSPLKEADKQTGSLTGLTDSPYIRFSLKMCLVYDLAY
jgi:hypothetical protein